MSLFGDDTVDAPSMDSSRHSLFDDEIPGTRSNGGNLFDNYDLGNAPKSPWDIPSPRKPKNRAALLRSLLPRNDAPKLYADIFRAALDEYAEVEELPIGAVSHLLAATKLGADQQAKIFDIVAPSDSVTTTLGLYEFNVLLALIGLAQEGKNVSLDAVDERRKDLPLPKIDADFLPKLEPARDGPRGTVQEYLQSPQASNDVFSPPTKQGMISSGTLGGYSTEGEDPWSSDRYSRFQQHNTGSVSPMNGTSDGENGLFGSNQSSQATLAKATSSYMTTPPLVESSEDRGEDRTDMRATERRRTSSNSLKILSSDNAWGNYGGASVAGISNGAGFEDLASASGNAGTDGSGDRLAEEPATRRMSRTIGSGRTGNSIEETVTVKLILEKEGIFLFQHHNYEVTSSRRGSKVIRRYSDFVWLWECLHKRYPFRMLPLLPPKRVAVNGNHLSNDGAFLEKRRRGLARFLNALARHPILSTEQLSVMFLTVPTELSVWRKQATISVQDEFTGRPLPLGLEESLSPHLNELFERTRSGVLRSADLYITTCNIMDRLVKRGEGVANDHARMAISLQSLIESNMDTYASDTSDVLLLNDGLLAMSKHLRTGQALMEDEAKAWDAGVLEDLKRQRDALVSLRDLFDRRERLDRDNIPSLERHIQHNESKLATLRAKPDGMVKPGEIEKTVEAIIKDKESIVNQHNRSVFVKECLKDELLHFQTTQYHVSRWNQDWAQERVKYSEMLAENWRRLLDELDGMPLGD